MIVPMAGKSLFLIFRFNSLMLLFKPSQIKDVFPKALGPISDWAKNVAIIWYDKNLCMRLFDWFSFQFFQKVNWIISYQ